ncbi:unnamed protein product, partial [Ixodes hexagonus]
LPAGLRPKPLLNRVAAALIQKSSAALGLSTVLRITDMVDRSFLEGQTPTPRVVGAVLLRRSPADDVDDFVKEDPLVRTSPVFSRRVLASSTLLASSAKSCRAGIVLSTAWFPEV